MSKEPRRSRRLRKKLKVGEFAKYVWVVDLSNQNVDFTVLESILTEHRLTALHHRLGQNAEVILFDFSRYGSPSQQSVEVFCQCLVGKSVTSTQPLATRHDLKQFNWPHHMASLS